MGKPDYAAEAYHNAAVMCLIAANSFTSHKHSPPPGTDPKSELKTVVTQALDLLDRADAQLDPTTFTLTHYKIYKRKAHALLRTADPQPESIHKAVAFINKAKKYPGV